MMEKKHGRFLISQFLGLNTLDYNLISTHAEKMHVENPTKDVSVEGATEVLKVSHKHLYPASGVQIINLKDFRMKINVDICNISSIGNTYFQQR